MGRHHRSPDAAGSRRTGEGGDRDAFTELQRGTIDRLYAIARLILRDGDKAQDATQEAYIAAWRRLSGLRDADKFEPWMRRLLVNA